MIEAARKLPKINLQNLIRYGNEILKGVVAVGFLGGLGYMFLYKLSKEADRYAVLKDIAHSVNPNQLPITIERDIPDKGVRIVTVYKTGKQICAFVAPEAPMPEKNVLNAEQGCVLASGD
jgi:hypothetical protein